MYEALAAIKGTMSPQAHACDDAKHFEIVSQTFSNTVGESEAVFIYGKLIEYFVYKSSLVITEAVCCHIFESFSNGGKAKILRRVVCKFVSTKL